MKKTIIMTLGLIMSISLQSIADTRASVLLLHNGHGTTFDGDKIQIAINTAISGDTIYLSEGNFGNNETLTIDKVITVIGTGQTTKLRGSIDISIDGEPTLSNYMLSGMRITGDVIVKKKMNGIKVKKCWIGGYFYATSDLKAVEIDKSYIMGFVPTQHVKSAVVTNCILYCLGTYNSGQESNSFGNDLSFINCSIASVNCNSFQNIQDVTFLNSLIVTYSAGGSSVGVGNISIGNNTFKNCLCKTPSTNKYGDIIENCYTESNMTTSHNSSNDMFPTFCISKTEITAFFLQEKNYLGNNGTVVGAEGGVTPYTLETDGLHIKESVLKVDPETRKLNVTLKVSAE